jgi:hypothetical protein
MNTMEYMGNLYAGFTHATGGDVSSAGNMIVVRGRTNSADWAAVWYRAPGANLWGAFAGQHCNVSLRSEPQGEAICFDAVGCSYYSISEGTSAKLYYYARQGNCNLAADMVRDGVIDLEDFAAFSAVWPFDLNGDSNLDVEDLKVITDLWLELVEVWP